MLDDFTGRKGTAIVTGGSGGIGAAICRRLAQVGSGVAFTYLSRHREAESLRGAAGEQPGARAADSARPAGHDRGRR
jgi:3-oxoacyl-[acyl-carrier protein] reductase